MKSPSFRNTIELLSRSVCLLESFDNLSSLCHLSPFTHQPLFIWRPLPSLARTQNSHSFPGRRPNPTFAAVWVRLFVGELEFDQNPPTSSVRTRHNSAVCLQTILSGAAPRFISRVTSQMNFWVLWTAARRRQSCLCT